MTQKEIGKLEKELESELKGPGPYIPASEWLQEKLVRHKQWLKSDFKKGKTAYLYKNDLSKMDHYNVELPYAI